MKTRSTIRRAVALLFLALFCLSRPWPALTVLAGEQLGETDFDDGKGLPWHIVESEPAKMDFELSDGQYIITIINPGGASQGGEDRWDCQFRHRGLTIVSGHQYRVRYELTASNSGKYYTKIGNLAGDTEIWHNMSNGYDLDATWDPIPVNAGETKRVDLTFTAAQGMEVAEWAFHLGGDGQYTPGGCFPAGTVIRFDNMSLEDLSSDENDYVEEEPWARALILTNQLGYIEDAAKKATLLNDSDKPVSFSLIDENGRVAYEGKSIPYGYDADSGDMVHVLDFSEADAPGEYCIEAEDGARSRSFSIGVSSVYSSLLYDSLNYFYQNRSGIEIESSLICSGDGSELSRAAGHTPDLASVDQCWGYSASSGTQDVSGGWYDAGDHGKYVVNGGISLWLLQNMYEAALYCGTEAAYADGTMSIPENGNSFPDLLDEARWEMEWMFTMLVPDGSCRDMVYHKVHDIKWTGLGVAPADDPQERILKPPTTAATLNVAACAAQASRLWAGIDKAFAEECLDVAVRCYDAACDHPDMYAPLDESVGGGAYGDDDVSDEFYWAATELWLTTGEENYHKDMKSSPWYLAVPETMDGGESVGACGSFDWGHTAALASMSICLNEDACDSSEYKKTKDNLLETAEHYLSLCDEQGYGQPYAASSIAYNDPDNGYIWGSNSVVADNAVILAYAYLISGDSAYFDGAVSGMDYLLGRNPMDYSYVTGYGSHAVTYPHHRFWAKQIDDSFPMAPAGVLSGGPNSGMQDPWVRGMGWKKGTIPPAKCYLDHIEAWSVNECTINWNAPLAWLSGFLTEYSPGGITPGAGSFGSGVSLQTSSEERESYTAEKTDRGSVTASGKKSSRDRENDRDSEREEGSESNVLLIVIVIAASVLLLAVAVMIFVYKMAKLKALSGADPKNKGPDQPLGA
ncbi:MAG: glycoside hydrolase family 9 protein [Lachnospiraceae bacterium]|nr:glycoside hydrolase family 9 protein [Lachnospiraceae bacterium]